MANGEIFYKFSPPSSYVDEHRVVVVDGIIDPDRSLIIKSEVHLITNDVADKKGNRICCQISNPFVFADRIKFVHGVSSLF